MTSPSPAPEAGQARAARDLALRFAKSLALPDDAHYYADEEKWLARFTLAVCEPDEALVETVAATAIEHVWVIWTHHIGCACGWAPDEGSSYYDQWKTHVGRTLLAAVAQAAATDDERETT